MFLKTDKGTGKENKHASFSKPLSLVCYAIVTCLLSNSLNKGLEVVLEKKYVLEHLMFLKLYEYSFLLRESIF